MLQSLKIWKLSGALKSRRAEDAYTAVMELGRVGTPAAVDALVRSLSRMDGVSRSAARELGRIGDVRAVNPLISSLSRSEISEAATEGLVSLGRKALNALIVALSNEDPLVRFRAAEALGEIGDKTAVEPLVQALQGDNEYSIRTAAATALGQLKDSRAIWVLVGTLKLRDETTGERHAALEGLREAATLAMRKIGDPLSDKKTPAVDPVAAVVEELEAGLADSEIHPRLLGDLSILNEAELTGVLRELIAASEETSWSKLENREAVLPVFFKTYDQRRQAAETIGMELYRRGGRNLMRQVLEQLNHYQAIKNWWADLESRAE